MIDAKEKREQVEAKWKEIAENFERDCPQQLELLEGAIAAATSSMHVYVKNTKRYPLGPMGEYLSAKGYQMIPATPSIDGGGFYIYWGSVPWRDYHAV